MACAKLMQVRRQVRCVGKCLQHKSRLGFSACRMQLHKRKLALKTSSNAGLKQAIPLAGLHVNAIFKKSSSAVMAKADAFSVLPSVQRQMPSYKI